MTKQKHEQGDYRSAASIVIVIFIMIVIGTLIAMAIGSRLGLTTRGEEWNLMVTTMKLTYFYLALV